jgi:hypothetical protein
MAMAIAKSELKRGKSELKRGMSELKRVKSELKRGIIFVRLVLRGLQGRNFLIKDY